MADFDIVRDRTLLFFLDHLMEKGQQRTLHDLSCQFGAKGFTKEMRQIAGGSQSGLRKFLSQFPSLFSLDGDNVYITPLTNEKLATRDYTKETIEFFSNKLLSYGNAEVPIKSLFGHRSQASSEVRHVSGQNVREFSDFLATQSDVFVLRDEYVVLKTVLDNLVNNNEGIFPELKRMPEEISFDPYLMKQLVSNIEQTLFDMSERYCSPKISIEMLFDAITAECERSTQQALWQTAVKSSGDLIVFLHMNSRIFTVQGQHVSLTTERMEEIRESILNKQAQEPEQNKSVETPKILVNGNSCKLSNGNAHPATTSLACTPTPATAPAPTSTTSTNQESNSSQQSLQTASATSTSAQRTAKPSPPVRSIRSQILKIVSDNLQNDKTLPIAALSNSEQSPFTNCANSEGFDPIDLSVLRPRILVSSKECDEVIDEINKQYTEVALDIEGINLGLSGASSGEVTIVQLSVTNDSYGSGRIPRMFLFDVLLNRSILQPGGSLRGLLESEKVVKIVHDVRNISACLHRSFGLTLKSVFDTQVSHLVLQQQTTGKPAYKPTKYISLFTLSQLYGGPNLNPKMKDRLHKIYKKDANYWQRRPLTEEMIQFALTDVYTLLPIVYRNIKDKLLPEYDSLLLQLTYEAVFNHINSDEIKQIKKQRKFELELTDLKLKLFNNDKKKIVLSNREIRLLRYVDLTDEIRDKIEGPQNVAKKLKRFDKTKTAEQEEESSKKDADNNLHPPGVGSLELSDDGENEEYEEDESIGSSLRSNEFVSNSTDDSLLSSRNPRSLCWDYYQNDGREASSSIEMPLPLPIPIILNADKLSPTITTKVDASTQTLSTGDIVITKIHLDEPEEA